MSRQYYIFDGQKDIHVLFYHIINTQYLVGTYPNLTLPTISKNVLSIASELCVCLLG